MEGNISMDSTSLGIDIDLRKIIGAPHVLGLSTEELTALYRLLKNGTETPNDQIFTDSITASIEAAMSADILNSWLTTPTTLATDTPTEQKS